jgi:hypothetical protein
MRRNRLQFGIVPIFAIVTVIAALSWFLSRPPSFATFLNQDLRHLSPDRKQELEELLFRVLPDKRQQNPLANIFEPEPWHLWHSTDAEGNSRYILFEGRDLFIIPGDSYAKVYLLETNGTILEESGFKTGYRINLEGALLRNDKSLGIEVIEVLTHASINGLDIRKRYYGIIGNRIALLRLEDSNGHLVVNGDCDGPPVPKRDASEWATILKSSDPAVVLEALHWLSGDHALDSSGVCRNHESMSRAIEAQPGVQASIQALTASQHPWVREAAAIVQNRFGK